MGWVQDRKDSIILQRGKEVSLRRRPTRLAKVEAIIALLNTMAVPLRRIWEVRLGGMHRIHRN